MLIGHLLQSSSEKLLLNFNLKTEGSGLGAGLPHSHCLLIGISASLSIAQGASHLAVLGQVEGGDPRPPRSASCRTSPCPGAGQSGPASSRGSSDLCLIGTGGGVLALGLQQLLVLLEVHGE